VSTPEDHLSEIELQALRSVAEAVASVPQQKAMACALMRYAGNALAHLTDDEEAARVHRHLDRRHTERARRMILPDRADRRCRGTSGKRSRRPMGSTPEPSRRARVCYDCRVVIAPTHKWRLAERAGVATTVHRQCDNPTSAHPRGAEPLAPLPLFEGLAA
jgi:hypothetical protein